MTELEDTTFIPALKYNFLTPIFDPLMRWTLREKTFKGELIEGANLDSNSDVLDVGCGTGSLLVELKSSHPGCVCAGLDGDPKILDIARRKAETKGLDLQFDRAMSVEMPYENDSRDRVFSSLFFHHLDKESTARTLSEIFRVLRPGGELHVADWGKAQNYLMRIAFYQVQLLDGFATTSDNVEGLLPRYFSEAGFEAIEETTRYSTVYGTLSLYRATKPQTNSS